MNNTLVKFWTLELRFHKREDRTKSELCQSSNDECLIEFSINVEFVI